MLEGKHGYKTGSSRGGYNRKEVLFYCKTWRASSLLATPVDFQQEVREQGDGPARFIFKSFPAVSPSRELF